MFLIFLLLSLTSAVIDAQCPGIIPRINVRNPVPNYTLQIYVNPPGPPVKEMDITKENSDICYNRIKFMQTLQKYKSNVSEQPDRFIFSIFSQVPAPLRGDVAPTVPNAIADIFMCQDGRAWVLVNYGISCNNVGSPNPLCVLRTC